MIRLIMIISYIVVLRLYRMIKIIFLWSRSSKDRWRREYEDRDDKSWHSDERRKRSRWDKETDDSGRVEHSRDRDGRMTRTLDGKKAGLQYAKTLREDTEAHKRREFEQLNKVMLYTTRSTMLNLYTCKSTGAYPFIEAQMVNKRNFCS